MVLLITKINIFLSKANTGSVIIIEIYILHSSNHKQLGDIDFNVKLTAKITFVNVVRTTKRTNNTEVINLVIGIVK
jgi:hypothetical protein